MAAVNSNFRSVHDSIGDRTVPKDAYYGVQSLRASENFHITGLKMHPEIITSIVEIKKASAITNLEIGLLDKKVADAIVQACDEIVDGEIRDAIIVDPIQGGAGTSRNMNANEVIAIRGIEILGGEGTIEKRIPALFRMYMNYGIDMRKVPIVIYPTLHYQNGGLEINGDGYTKEIPNLLVAGEAAGGIHGRNRLMGNSLLDVIVFGRNAGKKAAAKCKDVELGSMYLDHIRKYEEELKNAGVDTGDVSPMLLPKYARHER